MNFHPWRFVANFFRPSTFQRIVMSQLQDLKDAVASLTAEAESANAKVDIANAKADALIVLTGNITNQLAALTEAGSLPPAEMSALTAAINASVASIREIGTKSDEQAAEVDAAIAADTPPVDTPETPPEAPPEVPQA